ncbi:MAG TPA: YciI family protein [Polyangiaceae bacterium]|nr:YciI family protein [Polyangiaceae bacterium]
MRVMVIVKANKDSEAGKLPSAKALTAMMKFNEELVRAGIMLAGEGLKASSHAKRIIFDGGRRTVVDGPFTETKELVAGYWLWQVKSIDEAVEWLKRMPQDEEGAEPCNVEIRPVFEADDFGENLTPETRAKEAELRRLAAGAS